jgi:hypothetical protein
VIIHGTAFVVAEAEHTAACYCYSADTAAEHNLDSAEEESQPICLSIKIVSCQLSVVSFLELRSI